MKLQYYIEGDKMAINNHIKIPAQPSIYTEIKSERYIDVYYSLPERGTNENTGVLMYIYGFRGYAEANIFKKMRDLLADKYNLIIVQCNYFGYEFMQKSKKAILDDKYKVFFTEDELLNIWTEDGFQIDEFVKLIGGAPFELYLKEDLTDETEECFAEMGIMQAMDNINALITVLSKIKENGQVFNSNKIMVFGNSHGAYLSHLCNILAPGLISLIIDNSGWIFPRYFVKNSRVLTEIRQETKINIVFDYKARYIIEDFKILDLESLYSIYDNKAKIIAFHGENDELFSVKDKSIFINSIENAEMKQITLENLSEYKGIFLNVKHGLGANFITLFEYVMSNFDLKFDINTEFELPRNIRLETDTYKYEIDYTRGMPVVERKNMRS